MDSAATSAQYTKELALRSTNWQVSPKLEQNIHWATDRIFVDVNWSENRFSPNPVVVHVQHSPMPSTEKAIEYVRHILENAFCIRRLDLKISVSSTSEIDRILEVFSSHEKVRLEELFIRRRYVGSKFVGLIPLIRANAKTLKQIGKIGLGEAIKALSEEVHLERLSLINFDLVGDDGRLGSDELAQTSRDYIRRLSGLGTTFDHLSYTCYTGFELTKMPVLSMLRQCQVKSLRLTMQTGLAIVDPELPRPLLPMLQRIQLVGNMDIKVRCLSLLFPGLEQFEVDEQDLASGQRLEKRSRVLSDYVADFRADYAPDFNPVAEAS